MNRHRLLVRLALLVVTSLAASGCSSGDATPEDVDQSAAALDLSKDNYLAIGDSVPFGFDPTLFSTDPNAPLPKPEQFVGYPEALAKLVPSLRDANVACPGETSTSFGLSLAQVVAAVNAAAADPTHPRPAVDRGCYQAKGRNLLHVGYTVSQADEAVLFLKSHPQTKLVTLTLGGNDVGAVQDFCTATNTDPAAAQQCALGLLPGALATLQQNLTSLFRRLRSEAGYRGRLITVTYYSLDYTVPPASDGLYAVDTVLSAVSRQFGADVVSGYDVFEAASGADGSPCNAGLLIPLGRTPAGALTCDVHPTPKGRDLLARAIRGRCGG